jgi:hypothetical protein
MVVVQKATNSHSSGDPSRSLKVAQSRMDKPILQTLVVSFRVIVRNELAGRCAS